MPAIDLTAELDKLGKSFDQGHRFLPTHLRDEQTTIRRAIKQGAEELQAKLDAATDDDFNPFVSAPDIEPREAAELLGEWARGEDPAKVARVLEAIRGGHVSDLSLIF